MHIKVDNCIDTSFPFVSLLLLLLSLPYVGLTKSIYLFSVGLSIENMHNRDVFIRVQLFQLIRLYITAESDTRGYTIEERLHCVLVRGGNSFRNEQFMGCQGAGQRFRI